MSRCSCSAHWRLVDCLADLLLLAHCLHPSFPRDLLSGRVHEATGTFDPTSGSSDGRGAVTPQVLAEPVLR